jgi:hypothetical protein
MSSLPILLDEKHPDIVPVMEKLVAHRFTTPDDPVDREGNPVVEAGNDW